MSNVLTAAQTAEFNAKGFTYARGLFAPDEVRLLTEAMEKDPAVRSSILDRRDGEGRSTRIALWNRAGDALIFHCNAIHRSDANRSANRRWTLLICYNRVDNDTIIKSDDRYFVPLDKVDDGALRRAGLRFASGDNQEHFASRPYVPDLRKAS